MIDISHYINKLEILKEWLFVKIDGRVQDRLEVEWTMRIYNECGVIYTRRDPEVKYKQRTSTFEEYYKNKTNNNG